MNLRFPVLYDERVRAKLQRKIAAAGVSRKAWAKAHGISNGALTNFLSGSGLCPPGARELLGVEIVLVYRKVRA